MTEKKPGGFRPDSGGVTPPASPTTLDLRHHIYQLDPDQFKQLQHTLVVSGVATGLLALGRMPTSPSGLLQFDQLIALVKERL